LAALRGAGYQASGLHWNPQAFKTNASIAQCLALARPV
jgi:tRNA G26 N,N-dimethylase Trm1